jgi:hypothetical protein
VEEAVELLSSKKEREVKAADKYLKGKRMFEDEFGDVVGE